MPAMVDPMEALESFQRALSDGRVAPQPGALDPKIFVHLDAPTGAHRFTFVRLEGKVVTALVILASVEPLDGHPCFQMGYAVPKKNRGKGLAQAAIAAAVAELHTGLARNGVPAFYVEAVVGIKNEASKRVAEKMLSASPKPIVDEYSGEKALHYAKLIGGAGGSGAGIQRTSQ